MIGISDNLVPWFYGSGFEKVAMLLKVSGFLVIAIGLSNITGLQYLVPTKQQSKLTKSVCVGAVVNVILNAILIPKLYSVGAAIASVIAEFSVTLVQFMYVRKQINLRKVIKFGFKYFGASIIMLLVLQIENLVLYPGILATLVMVASGVMIYFIVLLAVKDSLVFEVIGIIKKLKYAKLK